MIWLVKRVAVFWSVKRSIINAVLSGMSETAKVKMFGEVIARQLPKYCIGHRPYQKNPKVNNANSN